MKGAKGKETQRLKIEKPGVLLRGEESQEWGLFGANDHG